MNPSNNNHFAPPPIAPPGPPTLWGLDPAGLHDRFWASRGTQVVRPGAAAPVADHAQLFLLTDPRTLAVFHLGPLLDLLQRAPSNVLLVRLRRSPDVGYREIPVIDTAGNLLRLSRTYKQGGLPPARVYLVRDPALARRWQQAADTRAARNALRHPRTTRPSRHGADGDGVAFDAQDEGVPFVAELVRHWGHPDLLIPDLRRIGDHVWAHRTAHIAPGVRCIGPAWIGAGRDIHNVPALLGPAAVWDAPAARPAVPALAWHTVRPSRPSHPRPPHALPLAPPSFRSVTKRLFDIAFASVALLLTLPVYPLIMLAIWLEDGRPFFFAHRRETLGGREFPCLKFRSMRKDSEALKRHIAAHNHADGPQFFIPSDPRLTRVGGLIRKLNLDELPQFLNVLLGHMSIVGPRPSPYKENQYCPAWREARLSVRPGITGLWQVMRTRRQGQDFQEWIRFDLEYVRHGGWLLDLRIILKTILVILTGKRSTR